MCIDLVDSEIPLSFASFIPTGSCTFPAPLLQGSLSPKGKDLMEIPYLWLNVPCSLILSIISGYESLYLFPSAVGESFSVDSCSSQDSPD